MFGGDSIGVGIGIGIGIEMSLGHERLDVYRAAVEYVDWAHQFCEEVMRGGANRHRYRYR